jgi:hypothetical protein
VQNKHNKLLKKKLNRTCNTTFKYHADDFRLQNTNAIAQAQPWSVLIDSSPHACLLARNESNLYIPCQEHTAAPLYDFHRPLVSEQLA